MRILCVITLLFQACSFPTTDERIICVANFIEQSLNTEQLHQVKTLEGMKLWEKWGDITFEIEPESYRVSSLCHLESYIWEKHNTDPHSFKGKLITIFTIQSQIRNQTVLPVDIEKKVDIFISERDKK